MIGENIKNARKAKGISQEEVAIKLNVVRQTVSKWEKGLSIPDADVLMKIADLLEISVGDLLGVKLQKENVEDLTKEIAWLKEQLDIKNQDESLSLPIGKKSRFILCLCFMAMVIALSIKSEWITVIATGGCILTALIILYRNLDLLTKAATADMKIDRLGTLKITTMFNIAILIFMALCIVLNRSMLMKSSESKERWFVRITISTVILFGGFISPKLPFNRYTGLRLPWTVHDEDTWNIAHKMLGYISWPLVLLYLAVSCIIHHVEVISIAIILLWIGIPGLLSLGFWWNKYHGK